MMILKCYLFAYLASASLFVAQEETIYDINTANNVDSIISIESKPSSKECDDFTSSDVPTLENQCSSSFVQIEKLVNDMEQAKVIIAQLERLNAAKDKQVGNYQTELADAISEQNRSFQIAKSLEEKLERVLKEHLHVFNNTFLELESMTNKEEQSRLQLKMTEERCRETQRQLSEREYELVEMHENAVSQYINYTLIGRDMVDFAQDMVSMTTKRFENDWVARLNPKFRRFRHMSHSIKNHLQTKNASFQRNLGRHWSQSNIVRPLVEQTWDKLTRYTTEIYQPYKPLVIEVRESIQLSALSAVEELSKGVIRYLDDHTKRKKDKAERMREREKKRPVRRHKDSSRGIHERRHLKIERDPPNPRQGQNSEASFMHKKLGDFFQFTLDNSEQLVNELTSNFPLYLTLIIGNCLIFGTVCYYFFRIPLELIWVFAITKLVYGVVKKAVRK